MPHLLAIYARKYPAENRPTLTASSLVTILDFALENLGVIPRVLSPHCTGKLMDIIVTMYVCIISELVVNIIIAHRRKREINATRSSSPMRPRRVLNRMLASISTPDVRWFKWTGSMCWSSRQLPLFITSDAVTRKSRRNHVGVIRRKCVVVRVSQWGEISLIS